MVDPSLIESKREKIRNNEISINNYLRQLNETNSNISTVTYHINKKNQQIQKDIDGINKENSQISNLKREISEFNASKAKYQNMNNYINHSITYLKSANKQYINGSDLLKKYYSSTSANQKVKELNNENRKIESLIS